MAEVFNIKHGDYPDTAVYIGRGSKYGNPFQIGVHGSRKQVIAMFCEHVLPKLDLRPLIGKDLLCFCHPKPCHGTPILAEIERRHGKIRSVTLNGKTYVGMSDEDFENDRYA
ncbi:hypothetical protein Cp1R7AA1_153 [Mesorhizobium phage Cp1R7A-A1]|nr:hypothetical protein Cp1R7AA1_153 [Mesorhizobium phage Cp1R7A-A1]